MQKCHLRKDDDNQQFHELQKEFLAKMDTYESGFSESHILYDIDDSDEETPCFIATSKGKIVAYTQLYYEKEYYDKISSKSLALLNVERNRLLCSYECKYRLSTGRTVFA